MAATAGAVVERLLRRLAADARRLELPSNIEEDVVHVGRTLARLQDLLASMERRYFRICADAQEWMGRIKQIVCDMEDLLDEFEDPRGIRSQKSGSWIAKISRSQRMKLIRRKLEISTEDSLIYSLMQHSSYDLEPSNKHQVFDGTAVIGRDDDKNNIKRLLMQDHADKLAIVPIVGPAGSGKTTLARLVFHDMAEVESNSELRIWVDLDKKLELKKIAHDIISQANEMENIILVSEVPADDQIQNNLHIIKNRRSEVLHCRSSLIDKKLELKKIAQDIIPQANEMENIILVPEVPADDQIQNNLQIIKNRLSEVLQCRSSLIVLDDLYSTDKIQLAELKDMLRGQKKCTKIIVTTSSETTAELVHSLPPYQLGPMSEGDCWKIFSQKAFNNQDANTNLAEIGKKIVKNCEGMPGIAYSLGSVMRNQDEGSWLWARDKEIWELEKRFSSGVKMLAPFSELYNNMPSALKLCFGYLSIFPKGSIIDKDKLVQQWMSLDMVGSTHGTLPVHVRGEMYIQDLLSMFFLRIQEMSLTTGIGRSNGPMVVQMNNLVHAFAKYVASNDLIILDCGDMSNSPSGEKINYNYVVVKNYAGQSTPKKELLTKARALSFKNCSAVKLLADAFLKLKHLRVLDLTRCHFVALPASIGCLKHLRYLDCSGLKIRTLPNQMSSLQKLEALDLSESYLEECPAFVGSYPHLAYLNLRGCNKLHNLPPSLGDLKRLQYLNLSYCSGVTEVLESLCGLHLLRFLDLSSCTELQELPHVLGNLTNLEYLNLSACSRLKNLPESLGNLVLLRFLNLSGCSEIQQLPESIIGLVNLQYLNLAHVHLQLPKSLSKLERLHTLDITGCRLLVSSDSTPTCTSIIQDMPNLKLLLADDSDIEKYPSQHIQFSTDVGRKSFQIRNLIKEEKSCAPEGANLVQMQSSPYPSNLQDMNLHEEIQEVTEDKHTNDSIDITKDIQCSPDVGTQSFQIKRLVKEGKSRAPVGANLVQMQSSSHSSNLEDVTLHDEIKEVTKDEHTNDSIDSSNKAEEANRGGMAAMVRSRAAQFPELLDRSKPLRKEMIIRVQTSSEKGHIKAIKVAASISGVEAVTLSGVDKNLLLVIGVGIDSNRIIQKLRRKVGYAEVVELRTVDAGNHASPSPYKHAPASDRHHHYGAGWDCYYTGGSVRTPYRGLTPTMVRSAGGGYPVQYEQQHDSFNQAVAANTHSTVVHHEYTVSANGCSVM